MMRAKLIEFTAVSFVRAAKSASAKSAFTMVCASSNEPFKRDVVDVRIEHRRHLAALHIRDATMGMQHHDIHIGLSAKRRDRRGARVARGGDDHGRATVLFCEQAGEEPAQELHRNVLEGERRPMKQLEQEKIRRDRHKRHDRVMRKAGIGRLDIGPNSSLVKASPMKGHITRKATSA